MRKPFGRGKKKHTSVQAEAMSLAAAERRVRACVPGEGGALIKCQLSCLTGMYPAAVWQAMAGGKLAGQQGNQALLLCLDAAAGAAANGRAPAEQERHQPRRLLETGQKMSLCGFAPRGLVLHLGT